MQIKPKLVKPFLKKLKLSFKPIPRLRLPKQIDKPKTVQKLQIPNKKSKYYGVHWISRKHQYRALFSHNSQSHFMGYFQTEILAAKAVDDRLEELGLDRRNTPSSFASRAAVRKKVIIKKKIVHQPKFSKMKAHETSHPCKRITPQKKRKAETDLGDTPKKRRLPKRQKLIYHDTSAQALDIDGKSSVTRFVGVNRCKRDGGKFRASLYWKGQKKHCGMHNSALDAALAINDRCRILGIQLKNPEAEVEAAQLRRMKRLKASPVPPPDISLKASGPSKFRALHVPEHLNGVNSSIHKPAKKKAKFESDELQDPLDEFDYCFEDNDFTPEEECNYEDEEDDDFGDPNADWEPNPKALTQTPPVMFLAKKPQPRAYMRKKYFKKSSKHKGVSYYKQRGVWEAYLHIPHKNHIGYFEREEEAAEAVIEAEKYYLAQSQKGIPLNKIFPKCKKPPEIAWGVDPVEQNPIPARPLLKIPMPKPVCTKPPKMIATEVVDMRIIENQTQYRVKSASSTKLTWISAANVYIPQDVFWPFQAILKNCP